jgi:UDP-N-acetylglucosamine acyltransferase
MIAKIDSTAQVADGAQLGAGVEIGPYCVIGPGAVIGDGCRLLAHVFIDGLTTIGPRTTVYPFVSLGTPPQSVHYKGEATRLTIGADCSLREHVTMNTGTIAGGGETRVGDRSMFMVGAHVGHDCVVGSDVIFANNATLGGHCTVGDHVFLGGLTGIHQHVRIGEQVIVGGMTGVEFDVIPFGAVLGARGELAGLNVIGLKRRKYSHESIHSLRHAYRMLFFGAGSFADRVDKVATEFSGDANVQKIIAFIRAGSKRRLTLPRAGGGNHES